MLMLILPVVAQAGGSQDSRDFNPLIGVWHVEKDGQRQVYAVDGRRWVQGKFSAVARDNAVELYGGKGPDFLRNIAGYKSFPLSIYREVKNFDSGTLSVSFKTIGGKEDEEAPRGPHVASEVSAQHDPAVREDVPEQEEPRRENHADGDSTPDRCRAHTAQHDPPF